MNGTASKGDIQRRTENENFLAQEEKRLQGLQGTPEKSQDQKEVVVTNEVTQKILGKYIDVDTISQEELEEREQNTETEDSTSSNESVASAVKQGQQDKEDDNEFIDITEAEIEALENAGIPESDLEGKTVAEVKKMANDLINQQVDSEGSQTSENTQEVREITISDEYADQLALEYPFAKNLRGKTMREVMEIITNQNRRITQLENSTGNQETDTNSQSNLQTDDLGDQVTEEDVENLLNPTRDPKDVAKDLNAIIRKGRAKDIEEAVDRKLAEKLPNLQDVQNQAVENQKKQFFSSLGKGLPEGADPEKVWTDWKKDNANMPKDELRALVEKPNLMIHRVVTDYKLKNTSTEKNELEKNMNAEIKKQSYKNLRKVLKQKQKLGAEARFNFARDNAINDLNSEEGSAEEQMIGGILSKWINR